MAAEAGLVGLLAGILGTAIAAAVLSPLFGVAAVSELAARPAVAMVRRQDPVPVLKGDA